MKLKRKKVLTVLCIIITIILAGIGGFFAFTSYSISRIPKMSFDDMLAFTTKNNENSVITVGIIQNEKASYTVYGENGTILPHNEHIYEIGSITKTFTASLLFKAISEGKVKLEDSINKYLNLPEKDYYPTIRRLITHTSGYKSYYLDKRTVKKYFQGKNIYSDFSKDDLIQRIGKVNLEDKDYSYNYSNFGIAVIGAVISEIYKDNFRELINGFIRVDLGLYKTKVSNNPIDLGNYWDWSENDAYIPAGALTSTIEDMLKYAQLQMDESNALFSKMHEKLAEANASSGQFEKMNIHIDSVGAAWIIDRHNNIIWHNGGTGHYNSYIGFDKNKQIAVVILSNLPPSYRIPATVMGIKLLVDLQKGES